MFKRDNVIIGRIVDKNINILVICPIKILFLTIYSNYILFIIYRRFYVILKKYNTIHAEETMKHSVPDRKHSFLEEQAGYCSWSPLEIVVNTHTSLANFNSSSWRCSMLSFIQVFQWGKFWNNCPCWLVELVEIVKLSMLLVKMQFVLA